MIVDFWYNFCAIKDISYWILWYMSIVSQIACSLLYTIPVGRGLGEDRVNLFRPSSRNMFSDICFPVAVAALAVEVDCYPNVWYLKENRWEQKLHAWGSQPGCSRWNSQTLWFRFRSTKRIAAHQAIHRQFQSFYEWGPRRPVCCSHFEPSTPHCPLTGGKHL